METKLALKREAIAERIEAGELESLFGTWSRQVSEYAHRGWAEYEFSSGVLLGSSDQDVGVRVWKPKHNGVWLVDYHMVSIDTLLTCLDRVFDLDKIDSYSPSLNTFYFSHCRPDKRIHFFIAFTQHDVMAALRRAGVRQLRMMTFGDPFLSDGDRLAYLGERV